MISDFFHIVKINKATTSKVEFGFERDSGSEIAGFPSRHPHSWNSRKNQEGLNDDVFDVIWEIGSFKSPKIVENVIFVTEYIKTSYLLPNLS